jgi:predicted phage terminase large subunit-like protein
MEVRPQPGPQTQFLSTPADIAIYGGAAGGGKSFGLLMEALRHVDNPGYGATIFRRTYAQIKQQGGLWEESSKLYAGMAESIESPPTWRFPSGAEIQFRHLQYEKDKFSYQGAQIPFLGFDELTHFTEGQFFYMLSRNRSADAGIRPYVRATTNPDPDSWVREFIDWWIGEDGYPIEDRSGIVRWFVREDGDFYWSSSKEELNGRFPEQMPKSVTFIPAKLEDNQILLDKDPQYKANLLAQDRVTREQLLGGNWDIRPAAGLYFKRRWLPLFGSDDALPDVPTIKRVCRYWDMAATEPHQGNPDPDYLVGLLLGELKDPHEGTRYIVLDVERHRKSPGTVKSIIQRTARKDADDYGRRLQIRMEEQPGSAGKSQIVDYERLLSSYDFRGDKVTGDKITRAEAPSSAAEPTEERPEQEIGVRKAPWNEAFLQELESFPDASHDDQVDALSGAFNCLTSEKQRRVSAARI